MNKPHWHDWQQTAMNRFHGLVGAALLALAILPPAVSCAKEFVPIEISSSPNPVGSGARALGMGGAFIGVADDCTAASWNPAGLVQLERPEISMVGAYSIRTEDISYAYSSESSGPQQNSGLDVNYLSAAYPFVLFNRNMLFSLNFQKQYDFSKTAQQQYSFSLPDLEQDQTAEAEMDGALKTISPAFAARIFDSLSLGMTINLWRDDLYDNAWTIKSHLQIRDTIPGVYTLVEQWDQKDTYSFSGYNVNLGLLWNINRIFSLGMVLKTPFTASLEHHDDDVHSYATYIEPDTEPVLSKTVDSRSFNESLDMPMSYGAGIAARLSDELTLDLDLYHTEWDRYVLHTYDGRDISPVTGKETHETRIGDTTQVRLGGEYLLVREQTVIPCRAGLFYDPEPWEGSAEDFWGISIGSGIAYKNLVYDIAYQYRFAYDVRANQNSSQDVRQHTVYMSVIYHF